MCLFSAGAGQLETLTLIQPHHMLLLPVKYLEHLLDLGHRFASKVPYTTLNVFTIVYLIHSVLKIKTNWLFKRNKHILEGQLSRHLPGSTVKVFNNI